MTPDTLRRKLQKKKKRKPYRKCPKCGNRMDCYLTAGNRVKLVKQCVVRSYYNPKSCGIISPALTRGCGYKEELFWTGQSNSAGGGNGRHIPHGSAQPDQTPESKGL